MPNIPLLYLARTGQLPDSWSEILVQNYLSSFVLPRHFLKRKFFIITRAGTEFLLQT